MMNPFPRKLLPKAKRTDKTSLIYNQSGTSIRFRFQIEKIRDKFLIWIVVLQSHGPDVCAISTKSPLPPRKALLFQNYDQKILNYTSWRSSLKIDHLLFLQVSWAAQDDGTPYRTERKKYAPLIGAGERKFNSNLQAVMYGKANSPFIKIREYKSQKFLCILMHEYVFVYKNSCMSVFITSPLLL